MEITFNGLTYSDNVINLTGSPNILTFTGSSENDSIAEYRFELGDISTTDLEREYSIYFGDYYITSTREMSSVGGTVFYLPIFNSYENQVYSTHTIVNAFRNIPFISANYDVWQDDGGDGSMDKVVHIKARRKGANFNVSISTDMPASSYDYSQTVIGGTDDAMLQGNENKVLADLYSYDTNNVRQYVTTLQKAYYGKPVSFNVSSVLSSLIEEEDDVPKFDFDIYGFSNGKLTLAQRTSPMYITSGYIQGSSQPFINAIETRFLAANVAEGEEREKYNNTYLYTYSNNITFSVYEDEPIDRVFVNFIGSAEQQVSASQTIIPTKISGDYLATYTIAVDLNSFNKSNYIDVQIPNVGTVRYNVIKPINGANSDNVTRIYYRNEYNGISFFDFTGEKSENRKTDYSTYDKQDFDFYVADGRERNIIYSKTIDTEVKVQSHFIEENGLYSLYSLQHSKNAWVVEDGIKKKIIITNLEISEGSNVNHVFRAQVTFNYSYI